MKRGEKLEGKVVRMDYPGKGIVVCKDREIAVKDALPGQTVQFAITKAKKENCSGRLLSVSERSAEEAASDCPHSTICGGCSMRTLSYKKQLEIKEDQIRRLLEGAGCKDVFEGIHASPDETGYRNKMEFSFGDEFKDGPLSLGMHKKGSFYDIVTVDCCRIVHPDFLAVLTCVLDWGRRNGLKHFHRNSHEGYLRHLLIRRSRFSGEVMAVLVTSTQIDKNTEEKLLEELTRDLKDLKLEGELSGFLHTVNDRIADVIENQGTTLLCGKDYITEKLLGLSFRISPFSFFQTNSAGAEVLYSVVREYAGEVGGLNIFDLYSGTGTIAQILADVAAGVTGVEIVEEAVEAAKINAALNNLTNCTFIAGDVLKVVGELEEKPDLIVLDPPRDGIHPKALSRIIGFGVDRIVYVSCKATSLVRDLEAFYAAGYEVKRAACIDLFPGTAHVEVAALLERVSNRKADSYVKLNVKMEDYYRIKDSTGTGKCGGVTEDE